jgi:hypothetical protein
VDDGQRFLDALLAWVVCDTNADPSVRDRVHDFSARPSTASNDDNFFVSTILCRSEWGNTRSIRVTETIPGTAPTVKSATIGGGWLRGHGLIVKFQEKDFNSQATSSGATSASSSSNGQSSTSTGSATSGGDGGGLGTGASIGIGVGVGVIGLALVVGLVWFLLRMRKKKKQQTGMEPYTHQYPPQDAPVWTPLPSQGPPQGPPQELPATTKYAHDTYVPPQELDARR